MIRRTKEMGFGNEEERDVLGNPMNNPNIAQEQPMPGQNDNPMMNDPMNGQQVPPMGQPMGQPMDDDMLKVISNMQEALAQISSRLDKIENKPIEDNEQEIPVQEEVHIGGGNEKPDFNEMGEKGKMKGQSENPENIMQETLNRILRKMEDLTGAPEIPRGKKEQPINQTSGIPQSTQPASGIAPSGGGFDSDDKINEDDANDAEGKTDKPKKDYDKKSVVYNRINREAGPGQPLNGSKGIKKEGEDPTEPQPGVDEDKPDTMDMSMPEKNVVEETFKDIQREINLERRQSTIMNESLNNRNGNRQSNNVREYLTGKAQVNRIINEYLRTV